MPEWLYPKDVSEVTGVPVLTLRTWRARRTDGPRWTKHGQRVKYRKSDVDAWLAERDAAVADRQPTGPSAA